MSSVLPSPSRLVSCAVALATILSIALAAASSSGSAPTPAVESLADAPSASAEHQNDEAAVRKAALDYVLALYEADASRVERSVDRELTKFGYYHNGEAYRGTAMTYAELHDLAKTYNDGHSRFDPDTTAHEVVVFEVLDKTASARITAHWGVDYMHLAKVDGQWRIRNILWQSRLRDGG
jgi:hypothetical protein